MPKKKKKSRAEEINKHRNKDGYYLKTGKKLKNTATLKKENTLVKFLRGMLILLIVLLALFIVFYFNQSAQKKKAEITFTNDPKLDLNDLIDSIASDKLGVDEKNYRVIVNNDINYIKIGLNEDIFDLLLANSILTGSIQNAGGELVEAIENERSNSQELKFKSPNSPKPVKVKLYYGDYLPPPTEVVLIVDDFGSYANSLLDSFCALPPEINFAILPNEPFHREAMLKADSTGHEVLIHIPMEPYDSKKNNPGNDAILVQYSPQKLKSLVNKYLECLPYAIAANNHMGSLATSRSDIMRPVLQELDKHGLFFIDSYTTSNSVVKEVAVEEKIEIWERKLFLDEGKLTNDVMDKKIARLNALAKNNDEIIVIGHCHSKSRLDFIKVFIDKAQRDGFVFSPVSSLKKDKEVIDA